MASRTESPENNTCCSSIAPREDFDAGVYSAEYSTFPMAGGGLEPQPASGEVLEMIGKELSHIDQQEHGRNMKIPHGSLDPTATIAGSALKGCSPDSILTVCHSRVWPLQWPAPVSVVAVAGISCV